MLLIDSYSRAFLSSGAVLSNIMRFLRRQREDEIPMTRLH